MKVRLLLTFGTDSCQFSYKGHIVWSPHLVSDRSSNDQKPQNPSFISPFRPSSWNAAWPGNHTNDLLMSGIRPVIVPSALPGQHYGMKSSLQPPGRFNTYFTGVTVIQDWTLGRLTSGSHSSHQSERDAADWLMDCGFCLPLHSTPTLTPSFFCRFFIGAKLKSACAHMTERYIMIEYRLDT